MTGARPAGFLDAAAPYPMRFADRRENGGLVQLARAIDHPNIEVGDFTYASSFDPPADWRPRDGAVCCCHDLAAGLG